MSHARLVSVLALAVMLGCAGGDPDQRAAQNQTPHTSPAPLPLESKAVWEAPHLTTVEIHDRLAAGEKMLLVDVRSEEAWEKEHIEGALSVPWSDLDKKKGKLPRDKPIVLYCA